ncbi:MAG: hypothetical protein KDK33_03550 [Leptospiraceae bacterium]|nr:hypothetical protein [Leptospiraceae bacterium]
MDEFQTSISVPEFRQERNSKSMNRPGKRVFDGRLFASQNFQRCYPLRTLNERWKWVLYEF